VTGFGSYGSSNAINDLCIKDDCKEIDEKKRDILNQIKKIFDYTDKIFDKIDEKLEK